jgi:salicylate hydroxylase
MSVVFDLTAEQRGKVVHRAALLSELLKPIDGNKKHMNKKVVQIDNTGSDRIVIRFDKGTSFEADAVIGADGLNEYVRGHVLGKKHQAVKVQSAGFWDSRSLIPIQKAKDLLEPGVLRSESAIRMDR